MDRKNWFWFSLFVGCALLISFFLSKSIRRDAGEGLSSFPSSPIRIVSLGLYSTEILCDLGMGDKIVAIGNLRADYPYYQILKDKPIVGSDINSVNVEKVLGFKPDLVFCWKFQAGILRERGLNVYVSDFYDVEGIMKFVLDAGKLVRKEKEAEKIVSKMKERIKRVKEKVSKIESKPLVYFEALSLGKTRSSGSLTNDLITRAGGINIAEDEPVPFPILSQEFIIKKNPDVIIIKKYGASPEDIKKRDGWQSLKAVKSNRIFVSPSYFTGYTLRCLDGLEQYAKWFYPEAFK